MNNQRVTPTRGQYPIVFGSSRGTDWPNLTTPDFLTTTWQFSSRTTSGSAASVTSTKDEFSSHGQEGVGDLNMYRPSHGDSHANRGLTSSEMVHSERREESLRSYAPLNDQHEGSFAPVSWREAAQSQGTDWPNRNENLPSNKHQLYFSRFENVSVGNKTQAASPSLGVRPLAPPVRDPVLTTSDFLTTTWQFSSSTTSGSVVPVTSTNDEFSSHGQEGVGDLNMYRPSHGDTQANRGLTSSEMVHSERREESLRSHGPFNYQRDDSFASVSHRDPSLVSLEKEVAEIIRVLKERLERIKKRGEAAQRRRITRSRKQREVAPRHRNTRSRKQREVAQRRRDKREKKQREETFPRFENVSVGNENQTASPSLEGDAVRNSAVTKPSFGTSTNDVFSSHGQQRVGDFNRYWPSDGVVPALSGLPSSPQETPFWQCEHYQRRCTVKFPCCGVFYPCERCHNLSGTCPANDKKARHATHVKCRNCGREEEVSIFCILGILS